MLTHFMTDVFDFVILTKSSLVLMFWYLDAIKLSAGKTCFIVIIRRSQE